jgi:hypothetical protein
MYNYWRFDHGSLGLAVKISGFGGESVRTHALTPKSGVIPRQILKNLDHCFRVIAFERFVPTGRGKYDDTFRKNPRNSIVPFKGAYLLTLVFVKKEPRDGCQSVERYVPFKRSCS